MLSEICPILKISSVWTRFFEKITVRRRILSSASPKPLKIRKEKMSDKYTGQKKRVQNRNLLRIGHFLKDLMEIRRLELARVLPAF